MSYWVRAAEHLPEPFAPVLVVREDPRNRRVVELGFYIGHGRWKTSGAVTRKVVFWMELPGLPEEV